MWLVTLICLSPVENVALKTNPYYSQAPSSVLLLSNPLLHTQGLALSRHLISLLNNKDNKGLHTRNKEVCILKRNIKPPGH